MNDSLNHSLCRIHAQKRQILRKLHIFVAKHVSLSTDRWLFSGVERFSPFFKLTNTSETAVREEDKTGTAKDAVEVDFLAC